MLITKNKEQKKPLVVRNIERTTRSKAEISTDNLQAPETERVAPIPDTHVVIGTTIHEYTDVRNGEDPEAFTLDSEIENQVQPQLIELEPDAVEIQRLTIVEQVVEATAVSHEAAEQATTLLVVMPEKVRIGLKEYIQNAVPEAADAVEAQVVMIARVSDRLHELVITEQGDSEEAEQIEAWLTGHYAELLNALEVEYDEETIKDFIELVRSDKYEIDPKTLLAKEPYDPMRERKDWSDSPGKQSRINISDFLCAELARFTVHHGLLAAPTSLAA